MNVDLDKTLGYDLAKRNGIEALHKTLTRTQPADLGETIAADLTAMLNQAINTMLANPTKPGATLPLAQVTGYLGELATVTGMLATGKRFAVEEPLLGDPILIVSESPKKPPARKAKPAEMAGAGINL